MRTAKTDQTEDVRLRRVKADLSLRWAHRSVCWFCHAVTCVFHFISNSFVKYCFIEHVVDMDFGKYVQ